MCGPLSAPEWQRKSPTVPIALFTRRIVICLAAICGATPALAIGPYDARDAAECRAQVEANFQAIAREMAAGGNYRGITSTWNRWRGPAMEQCEQMDNAERHRRMRKANARLEAAIVILRENGGIRAEEVGGLAEEHTAITSMPHSPYRDAHMALYMQYQRYANAPSGTSAPQRCEGIGRAMKSARTEHDLAVDALLRREPEWRVHDQVRQAAIAEMQYQGFLAKRSGCAAK
jgi:hypothetical protein